MYVSEEDVYKNISGSYFDSVVFIVIVASFPLPCGFRLVINTLDQLVNVDFGALVEILPYELIRICCRPSVAASSTYEDLAVVFGCSWDLARWKLRFEGIR